MDTSPIMGSNGMVTSPHPLASQAGINILKEGGNAFDAAITVNAVLGVVYPHFCGIGGDVFYLFYSETEKKVCFLNGSGRFPLAGGIDLIRQRGFSEMPKRNILSVTVPGCVHAWGELWEKYGSLSWQRLLEPAWEYAENGFPLDTNLVFYLQAEKERIYQDVYLHEAFVKNGKLKNPGQIVQLKRLAHTLKYLAQEGKAGFYQGELAQKIAGFMVKQKGLLAYEDLDVHTSTWIEPISISIGEYTIYQTPPNSQGLALLLGLNILDSAECYQVNMAEHIFYQVEAQKLACVHKQHYITDPDFIPVNCEEILDKLYGTRLRKMISPKKLLAYQDEENLTEGAYFAVADKFGNLVSGNQNLHSPFGIGCSVGDTGILLQDRGASFSLDPSHINRLEPLKRPFHSLTACIMTRNYLPLIALGSSGSEESQIQLQVLTKLLYFDYNIQEALEAPRWLYTRNSGGNDTFHLLMEGRFPMDVVGNLESWGYHVQLLEDWAREVGCVQYITINPVTRVLTGGIDPRKKGYVATW